MKKFVGTKIVEAEEMDEKEFALYKKETWPSDRPIRDGYKVKYQDNYTSWSPKEIFEASYQENGSLNFGHTLHYLKLGKKVRLPYWSYDVFLLMQTPDEHSKMTSPYIYVTSRFGLVPWVATQIEMLSENWCILD